MLKFIHSYFAYIVITLLIVSTFRFLVRYVLSKEYTPTDFRLALITFIVSHTQLLIGLFLYFVSDKFSLWYELSFNEIITRPDLKVNHQIAFEELSTQDRISLILQILSKRNIIGFNKTIRKKEGKQGVAVSLLASLELAKDGLVELIQNEENEIYIKSISRSLS